MAKEEEKVVNVTKWKYIGSKGEPGALYGLGVIGVAVYYLQHATTFWMGILGIGKAIFWPAFLMYHIFEMLKM